MVLFFFVVVSSILLVCILSSVALTVSFRSFMDYEKSSPFECGFDPKNSARVSFSLRFFLLAVIFVIFDVEIIFLFPIPYMILGSVGYSMVIYSFIAFVILLLGLFHEWHEGSLNWSK